MRLEKTYLVGAALLLLASAATLTSPAPAGACSFADPCGEALGSVLLGGPTFELVEGDELADPPEILDAGGELTFTGEGRPQKLVLPDVEFWIGG